MHTQSPLAPSVDIMDAPLEGTLLDQIMQQTMLQPSQEGCLLYTSPSPRD